MQSIYDILNPNLNEDQNMPSPLDMAKLQAMGAGVPKQPQQQQAMPDFMSQFNFNPQQQDQKPQWNMMSEVVQKSKDGQLEPGATQLSPTVARPQGNGPSVYEKQYNDIMKQRADQLAKDKADYAALQGNKPKGFETLDLAPMFGTMNALTGSKLGAGYTSPTDIAEWKNKLETHKKAIDDNANKVGDDQLALLKAKITESGLDKRNAAQLAALTQRAEYQNRRNEIADNRFTASQANMINNDKIINTANNTLQGTTKAMGLLNDPHVVVDYAVLGDINNDLSQALSGARASVGGERLASHINTAYGQISKILSQSTGAPHDALPEAYRTQIIAIINDLNSRTAAYRNERVDNLLKGTDVYKSEAAQSLLHQKGDAAKTYMPGQSIKIAPQPQGGSEKMVTVIAPNGKPKSIPESQVQAALAAGGKLQ